MLPRTQDPNSYFQSDENIKNLSVKNDLKNKLSSHGSPVSVSSKVLNLLNYNGKLFVSESGFILRNLESGQVFKGHNGPVTCATIVGDIVFTGSWDKTLRIWDFSGRQLKVIDAHSDFVKCLINDGKFIYSSSSDKYIKKWDDQGKLILNFKGHNRAVESIVLCDQENILYSGSSDSTIKMWNTETGENLKTWKGHETSIYHVLYDETGLYSASADKSVKRWDGEMCDVEFKHSDFVNCVLVMSNYLLTGTRDGIITLWEINSSIPIKRFQAHAEGVTSLVLKNSVEFYSGSIDGTVRMWNIKSIINDDYGLMVLNDVVTDEIVLSAEEEAELLDL